MAKKKTKKPRVPISGKTNSKAFGISSVKEWGVPRGAGNVPVAPVNHTEKLPFHVIVDALAENDGVITYAAEQLGIARSTLSKYLKRYPELWNAYLEAREKLLDIAERNFIKIVKNPADRHHFSAIKFFLETVGRGRGYNARVDFTLVSEGEDIGGEIDYTKASVDELKEFTRILEKITVPGTSYVNQAEDAEFTEVPND